ncbi:Protein of unknown function, partial [Gryllus bimaculatus]
MKCPIFVPVVAYQNVSYPGMEMYSATKHAVRVLTEGLRKELVTAKSKIRVTIDFRQSKWEYVYLVRLKLKSSNFEFVLFTGPRDDTEAPWRRVIIRKTGVTIYWKTY